MKELRWIQVLRNYIINNYKEYILVCLLFLIGLFIGVLIVNNCGDEQILDISSQINDFIANFKNINTISKTPLVLTSAKNNLSISIVLWLAGTTVIGLPIVLIVILFRGITLGYTISALTSTLGVLKGIGFSTTALILQNMLFIPAVLTLGVSSIKLYKSIIKDKRKDNIKIEIIRHTIISILMSAVLILASIIENTISIEILKNIIKYF